MAKKARGPLSEEAKARKRELYRIRESTAAKSTRTTKADPMLSLDTSYTEPTAEELQRRAALLACSSQSSRLQHAYETQAIIDGQRLVRRLHALEDECEQLLGQRACRAEHESDDGEAQRQHFEAESARLEALRTELRLREETLGKESVRIAGLLAQGGPRLSLDDFHVWEDKKLGRGGFGLVVQALWKHGRGLVAIKRLRPDRRTPERVSLFRRECAQHSSLRHQHVLQALGGDWAEDVPEPFLVLPICTRGSLGDALSRPPCRFAKLPLAGGVASGMAYLHAAGCTACAGQAA